MLSPKETAEKFTLIGRTKSELSIAKMLILGFFAGMFIALAGFGATVAGSTIDNASVKKIVSACVFPVGLILVVLSGSELFTGNNLMIISVLHNDVKIGKMLKNWLFVYVGNLMGSIFVAALVSVCFSTNTTLMTMYSNSGNNSIASAVISIAKTKSETGFIVGLLKGIPCNILVCMAVWNAVSSTSASGKIFGIYFPIFLFVLCGFEHSVANMYYLSAGCFMQMSTTSTALPFGNVILNLLSVTLGNVIGGAGIVGCGYYFAYLHK